MPRAATLQFLLRTATAVRVGKVSKAIDGQTSAFEGLAAGFMHGTVFHQLRSGT